MTIECPNCDYKGKPKIQNSGSCLIAFVLMWFLFIPGVLYLFWMATHRKTTCPNCGYQYVIPQN